ncbi:MAG: VWA domain-containing protein [Puniceicoccales bacterium]|jgi:Ca-activated chloride channel family protein|nr:VWA domain-containing protein [Puniceicoccales bacterium]
MEGIAMNFLHPFWLVIGVALCGGLVVLFLYSEKQRRARRRQLLADKAWRHLVPNYSASRQKLKYLLCLLATLFCALALARPRWGYTWKEYHTQGVDVLFAVDVSRSMLAEDLKPNRLERTKITIQDFVRELHGHRIGLIAFAFDSFIQCPMTLDYRAFLQSVDVLDVDTIPQQGTAIASAVRAAEKALEKTHNERLVLLFSDGEELKKDAIAAAESAAKNGIHIFSIGVGTLEGGMIPIPGENRTTQYLKDAEGKEVVTKLDETTLKKLAEITDGRYIHLSVQELQQLLEELKNRFPIKEQEVYQEKVFTERFSYFLLAAIALWFLETLLSTYRRPRKWERRRGASWLFLCLMASLFEGGISESFATQSDGEKFFAKGQYGRAQAYYEKEVAKHPDDPKLLYNLGTTYLAQKNLIEASKHLEKVKTTSDPELQNRVFFDLGNICFEQGKELRKKAKADDAEEEDDEKLEVVQGLWENSISWYDSALALSKDYKAAEKNRRYVQRHLEELRRQREERKKSLPPEDQKNPSQQGSSDNSGVPSSGSGGSNSSQEGEGQSGQGQSQGEGKKDQKREKQGEGEEGQGKNTEKQPEKSPSRGESSGQSPAGSGDQASDASSQKEKKGKKEESEASPDVKGESKSSPDTPSESAAGNSGSGAPEDSGKEKGEDEKKGTTSPASQPSSEKAGQESETEKSQTSEGQEGRSGPQPNPSGESQAQKQQVTPPPSSLRREEADAANAKEEAEAANDKEKIETASDREGAGEEGEKEKKQQANRPSTPLRREEAGTASDKKKAGAEGGKEGAEESQGKAATGSVAMGNPVDSPEDEEGKMSLREARALLDSEAGDEKILPLFYGPPPPAENAQPW